jgi:hypothetical protein
LSELLDKEAIELFKDRLLNTGDLFLKEFVDCFMKFDTKSFHKVKSLREYNESLVDDNVMSGILKEYYEKTILEKDRFRNGFVDYFIHSFNIGESVNIIKTDDNFYKLEIYKNNRSISIADLGLGSLRVVSIILFLACRSYDINYVKSLSDENSSKTFIKTQKQILIIEEPESNLHPNWQSKMAELFIKTSNLFDINFIIETHSEYFIRNLQYLTAKHEINKDNSIIYNFNLINNIEKRITQIRKILILEDGMLSDDLGKGFFDEADRIAIDLYRLQRSKHQSN